MSAYDINTIIRLHSSHLPMPLPFNEDYYYQSFLTIKHRTSFFVASENADSLTDASFTAGKRPVAAHTPLCETQPLPVKKHSGKVPTHLN